MSTGEPQRAAPARTSPRGFTVGLVFVGPPHDGVNRFGRHIAAAVRQLPDVDVIETELVLTGRRVDDRRAIATAVQALTTADVVHVQYKARYDKGIWGPGWSRLRNLSRFLGTVRAPVVVTMHDVYIRGGSRGRLRQLWTSRPLRSVASQLGRRARHVLAGGDVLDRIALRRLLDSSPTVLVSTDAEAAQVRLLHGSARLRVIPHFVEDRPPLPTAATAKRALGLSDGPVVTLLGFIHERKGHRVLVDALADMPSVTAVFAGLASPADESLLAELLHKARRLGVSDRLRVTGYLDEHTLEQYLAATDVAVCPFRSASASGSLSTWISARRPIVASDLPLVRDYNRLVPEAIHVFAPLTPVALATAVNAVIGGPWQDMSRLDRLAAALSPDTVARLHAAEYAASARRAAPLV
jgi:glycosyltransferase involved in cell wall biosynthesis